MNPDSSERRYFGVFAIAGPKGRPGEQTAYDSEGRPVEIATDLVLEKDGWRVFWSRAVESGLEVTEEVRRDAEKALSEAQDRSNHLDAAFSSGVAEGGQRRASPVWRRLLVLRRRRNGNPPAC